MYSLLTNAPDNKQTAIGVLLGFILVPLFLTLGSYGLDKLIEPRVKVFYPVSTKQLVQAMRKGYNCNLVKTKQHKATCYLTLK